MKTTIPKEQDIQRKWILVDATDKVLGRLAVKIADMLRGKDRPDFTPHIDTGSFIVVINASKVKLTGNKEEQKTYVNYSGYRRGLKSQSAASVRTKNPERLIHDAVRRMLPKNRLMRKSIVRLKIYPDGNHPHEAQNPQTANI